MPKARINGIELYYETHGEGYPVVFLHGFSATHQMWGPQVPALSRSHRFVIYDARGHGYTDSPRSPDRYSADIVVEDLRQLLETLGIERAVLGGLSMGGYVSLRFCLTHPDRVSAMIVMDTGPGYRNPDRREAWNRMQEATAKRLETEGVEVLLENALTESRREVLRSQDPVGLSHMARKVVAQHDTWVIENLGAIGVPTLILVGEDDAPFLGASQYMARAIPGAELLIVPNAGHSANVDNPEFVNRAILDFLKKRLGER